MLTSRIMKISGKEPGPAVAVFAGVHGNETAGVLALQKLLPTLKIAKGTLYVAYANPPAIQANVRMLGKNMNRCFYEGNTGTDYEDVRARELMGVLDTCDALLDLHMFYDDEGEPFVICEDNALELARVFDVGVISTNWTIAEPGATDGYMYQQGKIGLCVECGPISRAAEYADFAVKTIYQFLQYFEMTDKKTSVSSTPKRLIRASHSVYRASEQFALRPGLSNFQSLREGQVIATDGHLQLLAGAGECIIFPHYGARVGEEAYIIGREAA